MKKYFLMSAAVLCCILTMPMFTACQKNEVELQSILVGTWTEKNDLYNDVLTLNEDGTFTFQSTARVPSFQSHANLYNGSGYYKHEFYLVSDIKQNSNDAFRGILHLNYGGKQAQDLRIRTLTSSTLELTNYNGDILRFSR